MDAIPAYNENFFRLDEPKEPAYPASDLYTYVPFNQRRAYDVRKVLACLFDGSEFMEFKADYGPEIVAGLAKVNGLLCGVITNYQGMIPNYPNYRGGQRGRRRGKLYRQGLIKMNEFVTLCARDRNTSYLDTGHNRYRRR
jgi:glutaconyl-CoA decarboxylase